MFATLINRLKQRLTAPALLASEPPDEFAHQPGVSYECSSIDRTILMSNESEIPGCSTEFIALGSLASSPTNPRKTFDAAAMAELVESVKQQGILQPILVRPWPGCYDWTGTDTRTDLPRYEIVAGERRFRAAKAAGRDRIPALVHWFSTAQVCEIQIVENLQRQDLHPLEEAEGYGLMMHEHGYSAEQLAEKIGKSRSYIFGRLKLLDLDTDSRRLFSGGLLGASTALLVARIPTSKLRAQAIKEITEKDYNEDSMSVREAQRWVKNRYMLKLADASFPIDDATLPGGSCSDCPKRTGNVRDLFDDIENPDVCTDPDCFGAKKLFVLERDVAKENGALVIVGKEAKKLAPNGIHDYSRLDDYTQLDNTCYDDKDSRTYREILGSSVETVLIEDTEHSRLVPMIPNTILAERLREAGIERQADKNAKDKEKVQAKLAIERAYRERLFAEVRSTVSETLMPGIYNPKIIEFVLWQSASMIFDRLYGDSQSKIASLWKAPGKNATERNNAFIADILPKLSTSELWRLLVDMTTIASVGVSEWMIDEEPKALLDIALLLELNPDEVRKSVIAETKAANSETKAAESGTKAAKKTKKPTPDTSADHLPPTESAQATETLRDDKTSEPFSVGDRVRVRDDIKGTPSWRTRVCGREGVVEVVSMGMVDVRVGVGIDGLIENLMVEEVERCQVATEAAQAGDDTAEQNQTLPANAGIETNETPIAIETGAGNGVQDLIETNEKPTGAATSQPAYRHPDDASLTWSGRGRRPAWVAACLSTGQALEDLKVAA